MDVAPMESLNHDYGRDRGNAYFSCRYEPHHFPNEYTGPTGGAATSKDDVETAPFQCEYRWYNLCPRHDGPYPLPLSGSSEDFVIHLDPIQSLWMQTGWILMAFVGGGCFCLLLRCFVRARGRYVKNPSFLQEFGFYTRDRERYLEYSLGVLCHPRSEPNVARR
eukprot:symbB.v1.2.016626.t1/scaffold1241.1/size129723/1